MEIAGVLRDRLGNKTHTPALRLSNLGTPCKRKLWYAINKPEYAEPLSPAARLKFLFGDVLESLLLFFAKLAGHTVTNRQEEVDVQGVKGHIDALIDDYLVDVKSASTASFNKFDSHGLGDDDPFGYLTQLSAYADGKGKSEGAFLAVDKTLGNLTLDKYTDLSLSPTAADEARDFLSRPVPPARPYSDEKDGESGNRKLCLACSYCDFKQKCWPGLRMIAYAGRPRWLTVVKREPTLRGPRR